MYTAIDIIWTQKTADIATSFCDIQIIILYMHISILANLKLTKIRWRIIPAIII